MKYFKKKKKKIVELSIIFLLFKYKCNIVTVYYFYSKITTVNYLTYSVQVRPRIF